MTQRFDRRPKGVAPRSLPPIGELWSKLTSEVAGILTDASPSPTPQPAATTNSDAQSPKPTTEMTTIAFTTVWRTSLVTVKFTTDVVKTPTPTLDGPQQTASSGADIPSSPVVSQGAGSSSVFNTIASTQQPSQSAAALESTSGGSSTTLSRPTHRASTTAAPGTAEASTSNDNSKHAIIGGLSGSIAGLLIIGVLIFFFLSRRKDRYDDHESTSEKGVRPALAQKWSAPTARDFTPNHPIPPSQGTSTPDLDGGLIQVSLDRWPRPYAHGEGYRESMGPRRLQVMNPSPSRPATPLARGSSESVTVFFNRQRSALAGVMGGATRPRGNSTGESPNRGLIAPSITIDPALSTDCVPLHAPAPSFRSHSSTGSFPVVEQRPPEDPFLTPPDERAEDEHAAMEARARRPGIAPLQTAAGAAGRTLSHIGSALNPFKSKSHLAPSSVSSMSRNSVTTFSSAGDQFQLDRASDHEVKGYVSPAQKGNWTVYEGT